MQQNCIAFSPILLNLTATFLPTIKSNLHFKEHFIKVFRTFTQIKPVK